MTTTLLFSENLVVRKFKLRLLRQNERKVLPKRFIWFLYFVKNTMGINLFQIGR